ncbi:uncharacterized protein EV420DRAFT_1508591 [Desarmillaria tabescens]|uniref:Uncharacterized protein n=1 Tax=Armillaria tabescens TaxID=1929756 RepID=A0AA39U2T2_ARMTA|nr:uncharacterized protein EV420DRAFT_1508591 [Desarmillaria tabescens]KAK0465900.1 hypothetical protein EV420DRAFT_1508591 [Desarmillaria tabescens]
MCQALRWWIRRGTILILFSINRMARAFLFNTFNSYPCSYQRLAQKFPTILNANGIAMIVGLHVTSRCGSEYG